MRCLYDTYGFYILLFEPAESVSRGWTLENTTIGPFCMRTAVLLTGSYIADREAHVLQWVKVAYQREVHEVELFSLGNAQELAIGRGHQHAYCLPEFAPRVDLFLRYGEVFPDAK